MPTYDLADLDLPFTDNEVWETIKQLPSDKAPGPDGFTGRFYKSCWAIIKDDVMAAISASRKFSNLGRLNTAYVTLIPNFLSNRERSRLKLFVLLAWFIALPN